MMRRLNIRLSAASAGLPPLLRFVEQSKTTATADDIFKICGLVTASKDPLQLSQNGKFMKGLKAWADKVTFSPFQQGVVDKAFVLGADAMASVAQAEGDLSSELTEHHDASVSALEQEATAQKSAHLNEIEEVLSALWEAVERLKKGQYVGSDEKNVVRYCADLEPKIRLLTKSQYASLTQALGRLNYKDYSYVMLLNRRGMELAREMTAPEAVSAYFNLTKLNSQDSLVALINCIERNVEQLMPADVQRFVNALERRTQASAAPVKLMPRLAQTAVVFLRDDEKRNMKLFRPLLGSLATYKSRGGAIAEIVQIVTTHIVELDERDLAPIMQSIVDLQLMSPATFKAWIAHCTHIVATIDMRFIDALIDVVSMCPFDSTTFMNAALHRLSLDGRDLSPQQMSYILDLLSSYPPAKGHDFAKSLAAVCHQNCQALDAEQVSTIVLSFVQLRALTDDFYGIVDFMFSSRRGFSSIEQLNTLLDELTREDIMRDTRATNLVCSCVRDMAPMMSDEDIMAIKKRLKELSINDKSVNQKMFGRQQVIQSEAMNSWSGSSRGGRGGRHQGVGRSYCKS